MSKINWVAGPIRSTWNKIKAKLQAEIQIFSLKQTTKVRKRKDLEEARDKFRLAEVIKLSKIVERSLLKAKINIR